MGIQISTHSSLIKKHEKLAQEVQIHHIRKSNRDFLCLWRVQAQALTWMYLEPRSSPKGECSASHVYTLVQGSTNTCCLPPGRLPGPLPHFSPHSWEQSFETVCSMVLMINVSLCMTLCSMDRPLGFYFPPCHTCLLLTQFNDFTISSEMLSPGPRLPWSPWQEGSGSRANHGSNRWPVRPGVFLHRVQEGWW